MHIIYIEFGISKSTQYKKVCNLAKQLPNYACSEGITQCFVDDIIDYVRVQDIVLTMIDKIQKWKNAKVLFYGKPYKSACDYYEFIEKVKRNAGKYMPLVRNNNEREVSLGAITYEDLPLPIVYYPEHYGAFFGFSEDIGEKIYFCECQRQAIENYIALRKRQPLDNYTGSKAIPLGTDYFPKTIAEISIAHKEHPLEPFGFKESLCFRCNKKIPLMKYCHPMYGGVFKQRFGWYIKQEEFRLGIDPYQIRELNILPDECTPAFYDYVQRLAHLMNKNTGTEGELYKLQREFQNAIENLVREQFGYPKIGDAWVSETMLFHIVEEIYPDVEIIRHHRPNWLEGLELDIYIPSIKLAFEYQGLQHFQAVEHWGGKEKLEVQKEHDSRKKRICKEKGVRLICVNYDEELTNEYIRKRIMLDEVESTE